MKLTKTKLTQLIKEELNKLLAESRAGYDPYHTEDQEAAWNKLQQDDALAALKAKMATGEPPTAAPTTPRTTAPAGSLKHAGVQAKIDGNSVMFSVEGDSGQRSAIAVPRELVMTVAARLSGKSALGVN
jgi:hypothetical protein